MLFFFPGKPTPLPCPDMTFNETDICHPACNIRTIGGVTLQGNAFLFPLSFFSVVVLLLSVVVVVVSLPLL
jgi:hypothetical protein